MVYVSINNKSSNYSLNNCTFNIIKKQRQNIEIKENANLDFFINNKSKINILSKEREIKIFLKGINFLYKNKKEIKDKINEKYYSISNKNNITFYNKKDIYQIEKTFREMKFRKISFSNYIYLIEKAIRENFININKNSIIININKYSSEIYYLGIKEIEYGFIFETSNLEFELENIVEFIKFQKKKNINNIIFIGKLDNKKFEKYPDSYLQIMNIKNKYNFKYTYDLFQKNLKIADEINFLKIGMIYESQ